MSEFENRLGHDGFVWWIGVVEDRQDPINLGRCRVRIFGSHTDNLQKIPTSHLPWAQALYPVNDSRSFGTPMENDYVFGFFADGMAKQAPVMMGVFPAIPQQEPQEGVGFSGKAKFTVPSNETKPEEVKVNVDADTPAQATARVGAPTTPSQAYTLVGTGIQKSNDNRVHVCDIAGIVKFEYATQKLSNTQIFQAIRTALESASSAAAASPFTQQAVEMVKQIRRYIKMVKDVADFINEVVLEIANFIKHVQAMIAFIKGLPAYLIQMLSQCLKDLMSALSDSLSFNSASSGLMTEINGLISDVNTATAAVQSTATNATATIGLLNPASYSRP